MFLCEIRPRSSFPYIIMVIFFHEYPDAHKDEKKKWACQEIFFRKKCVIFIIL